MELKLPELGEGVHEGELVRWLVKVGDMVKDDQVLAEIMTDKATVELPSHISGKVTEILAKEGETVHVNQVIMKFESAGGAAKSAPSADPKADAKTVNAPAKPAPAGAQAQPTGGNGGQKSELKSAPDSEPKSMSAKDGGEMLTIGGSVTAAPATRKLARESGIDITQVTGTGPDGRVTNADVEKFVSGGGKSAAAKSSGTGANAAGSPSFTSGYAARAKGGSPADLEERVPFKGLRKKIAEKMRQSKDHAAHFTYVEECDASALVALRTQAKEIGAKAGVKVTYLPFIMKAMVAALRRYPMMNSSLDEEAGQIVVKKYYNIALSVQTDDGLTAPVVKDVANKTILELAKEIEDLANRARSKKLTMEDLTGGTITLTNAGTIGGLFATPVINYPEVAILGFNKIFRKPVVKMINGKEEIVIRDWTLFSLSLDHRIVDGAVGAEFTKLFIYYIENPSLLLMESL
ncbi:MAG: 2-oxo acid dehydrogenase subunit E2 [Cryobacterium sp.]|nr:2-oxo acid dehydrogenase subunit E2 [Oligoflexia bacterium]